MRSQAPSQSEGESKGVRLVVLPILVDRLESMREELSKRFPIVPADVLSVHSNAKPCKALEVVVQGKGVRCHKAPESTGLKVLSTSLRENTRVPEMFDEVRGNYHGEFSSELEGLSVRNSDVIALHLTTLDFTRRGVDSQRRPSCLRESRVGARFEVDLSGTLCAPDIEYISSLDEFEDSPEFSTDQRDRPLASIGLRSLF